MKKRVIIFDMDGVLFDTISYAEKAYLESYPGMTREIYKSLYSDNFHESLKKYAHLQKEENEEERSKRHVANSLEKRNAPMFDGIQELLENLHNTGLLLILNTTSHERNCLPLLEKSGIKSLFDLIATAEVSKSKVEKFKLIEEKYNVDKSDILFITDSLGDIKEANIAGIPTIAVTWGVHDESFFDREKYPNIVKIVNTVKELSDFINK